MTLNLRKAFDLIKAEPYKKLREISEESGLEIDEYLNACDRLVDLYASPATHFRWNDYAKICLITGAASSIESSCKDRDAKGAIACTSFRAAIMQNACARFLSKQVIEAFEQTPVPELPPEVVSVLPHVHLMLPRHTVYDAEGDEVVALLVESGKLYSDEISKENHSIAKAFFPEEQLAPAAVLGASGIQISTVSAGGLDVFQEFVTPQAKSWHDSNVKYCDNSKYDNKNTEKIIRIAINSLLVHLYEPELITVDPKSPSRGVGFASGKRSPLAPTWIGKAFKRESIVKPPKSDPSTKCSVRSHWRRGHWRSQPVGTGRLERKILWIKPIYVNAASLVS